MPQKHASRKQSGEKEPRIPEVEVILGLPESSRIVTPKSGKAANKVSDSFEGFHRRGRLGRAVEATCAGAQRDQVTLHRTGQGVRRSLGQARAFAEAVARGYRLPAKRVDTCRNSDNCLGWDRGGVIGERLEWKFGGQGVELAKHYISRLNSDKGLTAANTTREGGLTQDSSTSTP